MATKTLAAAFDDLQGEVGFFLGYQRGTAFGMPAWNLKQKNAITRCVKGGMRKFYLCGHPWSFLRPMTELTLLADANTIIVPDDFGGLEGTIIVATDSGASWAPIQYGSISQVYEQESRLPGSTGRPIICCMEPLKEELHAQAARSQLHFWPTAEQDYTIRLSYWILPNYLSGEKPYAYGGPEHAETLLEACLSVAEKQINDQAAVHSAEFEMCLKRSKDIDARRKPANLGYNRDLSDLNASNRGFVERYMDQPVTFEGVQY